MAYHNGQSEGNKARHHQELTAFIGDFLYILGEGCFEGIKPVLKGSLLAREVWRVQSA